MLKTRPTFSTERSAQGKVVAASRARRRESDIGEPGAVTSDCSCPQKCLFLFLSSHNSICRALKQCHGWVCPPRTSERSLVRSNETLVGCDGGWGVHLGGKLERSSLKMWPHLFRLGSTLVQGGKWSSIFIAHTLFLYPWLLPT